MHLLLSLHWLVDQGVVEHPPAVTEAKIQFPVKPPALLTGFAPAVVPDPPAARVGPALEPDPLPVPELVLELEPVVATDAARAVCVIVNAAIEPIRSPDKAISTPMLIFLMLKY
jgi:hypothetical protein